MPKAFNTWKTYHKIFKRFRKVAQFCKIKIFKFKDSNYKEKTDLFLNFRKWKHVDLEFKNKTK